MASFRLPALAMLALVASATSAAAQSPAMICGTVTDLSGGLMPGVTVTLAGEPLAKPATTTTNATGDYLFPALSAGRYNLSFMLEGFKKVVMPGLVMTNGFEVRRDLRMEPGLPADDVSPLPSVGYLSRPAVASTFIKTTRTNAAQAAKRCR